MENAELLLKALCSGVEVELEGQRYLMANGRLCIVGVKPGFGGSSAEEVLLDVDMSLNNFIKKAENLPEEQALSLLTVLSHIDLLETRH